MASFINTVFKATSLANSLKNLVKEKNLSKVGDLYIDAVVEETILYENAITDNPVENGIYITDHIRLEPEKVTMHGYITDSPIRFMGVFETPLQANSLQKMIANAKSMIPFADSKTPSQQAFDILQRIRNNRELITVVTQLNVFKNMAIESLEFPKTPENRGRLEFRITLKKINFAFLRTTSNSNLDISRKLQKKMNGGLANKQDAEPSNKASEEQGFFSKAYQNAKSWIKSNLYD